MPSPQRHRGPHPEDPRLFAPEVIPVLRRAAEEVSWLLGRGYTMASAVHAAGDHHQLASRQRLALSRGSCSAAQREDRARRRVDPAAARGGAVSVDGLNLIITLEVALGGGVLVRGLDGCLRDLAGLRGSYHPVDETDAALDRIGAALRRIGAASCAFFLDAPVSNSGRLRARLLERAASWGVPDVSAELVADPDPILAERELVVTADAEILARCASFVNLGSWIVEREIPGAFVVDL